FNSSGFSSWISNFFQSGKNKITFYLGPPEGFSPKTLSKFNEIISLSLFTLNHQLALLVFCEQIYRALSIQYGEPYHKP
ncbi:23S rRNA (pseudouridine(1915)-N(3))-methyltransferase RlmH, partial [bacterium]|nr:23S rRNA (pseudouridine(1915)-N(3))-methyltransferase RlmH [bacterium]